MAEQLFTDGKAYERLMGRWSRLAGAAFLDWLNVPKAMRWLDAGCGNGAFTEEIIVLRPKLRRLIRPRSNSRMRVADRARKPQNFERAMRRICHLATTALTLELWLW
jgi:ubiquinone/menaquinone biosynthesis C-methylase UbiE